MIAEQALPRRERRTPHVLLERESQQDRQEIDDIAFEFEALQTGGIDLDVEIVVDSRPIAELALPGRVVFGRNESGCRPGPAAEPRGDFVE